MHGCHLPLLYIGLEYSLTNNQNLAEKFFNQVLSQFVNKIEIFLIFFFQALSIAPNDPFVLHELGVTAFTNQVLFLFVFEQKNLNVVEQNDFLSLLRVKNMSVMFNVQKYSPLIQKVKYYVLGG